MGSIIDLMDVNIICNITYQMIIFCLPGDWLCHVIRCGNCASGFGVISSNRFCCICNHVLW